MRNCVCAYLPTKAGGRHHPRYEMAILKERTPILNMLIQRSVDFGQKRSTTISRRSRATRVTSPLPPFVRLAFLAWLTNVVRISRGCPQGLHATAGNQKSWLANAVGVTRGHPKGDVEGGCDSDVGKDTEKSDRCNE